MTKRPAALLATNFNEKYLFPAWYEYYHQHFEDQDIYILDDGSNDGHLEKYKVKVVELKSPHFPIGSGKIIDSTFLRVNAIMVFRQLLEKYRVVAFAESDEFFVADPEKYPGGLKELMHNFEYSEWVDKGEVYRLKYIKLSGYDILWDGEPEIDLNSRPLLMQRKLWHRNWWHMCNVRIASIPIFWNDAFHTCSESIYNQGVEEPMPDEREDIRLIHFHYICPELVKKRWAHQNVVNHPRDANEAYNECHAQRYNHHFDKWRQEIPMKWRIAL